MAESINAQRAPYPHALAELVDALDYKPGYRFALANMDRDQGSIGLTLSITIETLDSYDHNEPIRVRHLFPVPPAAYDTRSWRRWVFDRIGDVDAHERAEFFTVNGDKPYAPSHGPGNDPYLIRELGSDLDRRTAYTGAVNP